jgi:hypothetical protein
MAIKFTTSDGKTFDSHEAATEHEASIAHLQAISAHIDAMLDESEIVHPANRTRAKNVIEMWEVYRANHDISQPDMFDDEDAVSEELRKAA